MVTQDYINYLFENILPLLIVYYDKYLSAKSEAVQQHISDDEERKDLSAIKSLAEVIASKLNIF